MARVIVIDERDNIAELLVNRLRECPTVGMCQRAPQREKSFSGERSDGYTGFLKEQGIDTVVYAPQLRTANQMIPDLSRAKIVFQQYARLGIKKVIVLSSAAIYGASPHNPGLISELRSVSRKRTGPIAARWAELEALAVKYLGQQADTTLTILRPVAVPVHGGTDYFSRLLGSRLAITLPGHDPSLQLLSPDDLASAVCCAVEQSDGGVFNVAPDGVIPLRAALRLSGSQRIPVPRWLQRGARQVLAPLGLAFPIEQLGYIRYSWTVSNKKIKRDLGFAPQQSSAEAVIQLRNADCGMRIEKQMPSSLANPQSAICNPQSEGFDDFGLDENYIAAFGRTLFHFLHRYYWRIEVHGLEQVPRQGRAVLVGMHRGFMPWDGVMAVHVMVQRLGRYPRFLIHPGLIKFPFFFNFMTKLGGIVACQQNAGYVLERDELLGIFPEGVQGAFRLYRDAYRLGEFRDGFAKVALRHRAPIIPFVTVGSAEIFPILGKIEWRWWKRHTEWPFIPLTPTFPLWPLPLPSKWHTQFLPPLHIENRYPPEAADDAATVRAISQAVRGKMEEAIGWMLRRRKSIFFGSVFGGEAS